MTAPQIDTYEVTGSHPDADKPLVVELIASSESAAIARTKLAAFHMYRDERWLEAEYVITGHKSGVWPDGQS
jgi:hypothetical protein